MHNLGSVHDTQQDTLLIKRSKLVGMDHLSTVTTVKLLSTTHVNRAEHSEAITCFEETSCVKRLKFGNEQILVSGASLTRQYLILIVSEIFFNPQLFALK